MKITKSVLCLCLVLAMMLTLSVPALAARNGAVGENGSTPTDGPYKAYTEEEVKAMTTPLPEDVIYIIVSKNDDFDRLAFYNLVAAENQQQVPCIIHSGSIEKDLYDMFIVGFWPDKDNQYVKDTLNDLSKRTNDADYQAVIKAIQDKLRDENATTTIQKDYENVQNQENKQNEKPVTTTGSGKFPRRPCRCLVCYCCERTGRERYSQRL